MDYASENGHVDVLEWWKNSGLKLKYSYNSLILSCIHDKVNVLKWWFGSGLKCKYSKHLIAITDNNDAYNCLQWISENRNLLDI